MKYAFIMCTTLFISCSGNDPGQIEEDKEGIPYMAPASLNLDTLLLHDLTEKITEQFYPNMTTTNTKTFFAPQLFIPSGVSDISFYFKAFGAAEIRRWQNDDGSIHVAELSINGTIFHLHEERPAKGQLEPNRIKGVTTLIGLFVEDVDAVMNSALQAGATLLSPAQDYDYGYRQGNIQDPFGHQWMIEMKIG